MLLLKHLLLFKGTLYLNFKTFKGTTPTMNFPVELLKINSHLGLVKKNNKRQSSLSVTPSHNRTHPMVGTKSELN